MLALHLKDKECNREAEERKRAEEALNREATAMLQGIQSGGTVIYNVLGEQFDSREEALERAKSIIKNRRRTLTAD